MKKLKKLKNKKDLELKLCKHEEFKSIKQDVDSSKIILKHMIAEKKESFIKLAEDVESNEKEKECLSSELIVSEKQLQNKKEILAMYNKGRGQKKN